MQARFGWPVAWWHSAKGIKALAGRLEVVEMAYSHLPPLWQSNLVNGRCDVYLEKLDCFWRDGKIDGLWRPELVERNWRGGRLRQLVWLEKGPFEAMAAFDDGEDEDILLYIPIMWRTDYQRQADTASLMRAMRNHLVEDERWLRLGRAQAESTNFRPGALVFSPGRVSAAMAQRHWGESLSRDNNSTIGIVDAEGQVVLRMGPPTAWWRAFKPPIFNGRLGAIDPVLADLETGAYAAVDGKQEWRVFRAVDRAPSVKIQHIAASAKVTPSVAVKLLEPMKEASVVWAWRDGHYVDEAGRELLEQSHRASEAAVNSRWEIFTKKRSTHRSRYRIHHEGQADCIMYLNEHGHPAFPAMGSVIEYYVNGQRLRIDP